ncbi:unnamed protein product [Linum tenue]|uniref:F-box domain-containing protein n=1 Tax=Linum tenue TaxID=586396 RepID=A0AAV0GUG7_9ROSI|nr:unnamed protein product [Linum tenue]
MIGGSSHWPTCKRRKKARKIKDRLSELPDHLLRRILSFVDSKFAVQTCLLSRRWRSVWKGVPALNLDSKSFNKAGHSFNRFASEILSRRYDSAPVDEMSLEISDTFDLSLGESVLMYQKLFDYAALHEIRSLRAANSEGEELWHYFNGVGFGSPAFRMLATLHLEGCKVYCPGSIDRLDPFSDFPNLRDLSLAHCSWRGDGEDGIEDRPVCLRISGIKLLNLRIEGLWYMRKIEIFAQNLESLYYGGEDTGVDIGELHLPSLDRAYVHIWDCFGAARRLMNMFRGLHSTRTLELHWNTVKEIERDHDLFDGQVSPFTRLKTLIFNARGSVRMPDSVSRYFFGNPSNKEKKSTEFKVEEKIE